MKTFNLPPIHRDLVSHRVVQEGVSPHAVFIAVFEYPDGTRTFDGKVWTALPDEPFDTKITNIFTPA